MPYRVLSKELQERAKINLNEDSKRIDSDLEHLKDWLKKQPHLNARLDDQFLLAFLRGCKFRLEKAKKKLDTCYTIRSMAPEFFKDRDPMRPEIQEVLNLGVLLPLIDKDDPLCTPVFLLRAGLFDPVKVKTENVFLTHMILAETYLLDFDNYLVNGMYMICDMKCVTMNHLQPPAYSIKVATILNKCLPCRPKMSYVLNANSLFNVVYTVVKPVFSEKMLNRLQVFSGTYEDIFKILPRKIFPNEYGGEAGTIEELIAESKKKVESYRDWFLEDGKYGCDESKRPGKPKTSDEMFGIEGSFRKLELD